MRKENYDKVANAKEFTLQIENGGTSANNKPDALFNLGAIDDDMINKPGGVLGLNANGFIDPKLIAGVGANGVTIEGPTSVELTGSVICVITNYDVFTDYVITTNLVTVTRENETLLVTGETMGVDGWFAVNGSKFPMVVTAPPVAFKGTVKAAVLGETNSGFGVKFGVGKNFTSALFGKPNFAGFYVNDLGQTTVYGVSALGLTKGSDFSYSSGVKNISVVNGNVSSDKPLVSGAFTNPQYVNYSIYSSLGTPAKPIYGWTFDHEGTPIIPPYGYSLAFGTGGPTSSPDGLPVGTIQEFTVGGTYIWDETVAGPKPDNEPYSVSAYGTNFYRVIQTGMTDAIPAIDGTLYINGAYIAGVTGGNSYSGSVYFGANAKFGEVIASAKATEIHAVGNASNSLGYVKFLYKNGAAWVEQQIDKAIGFGTSACFANDGSGVLVGSPKTNQMFYFTRTNGNYTEQANFSTSGLSGTALFGTSCAGDAALDRVAIGAPDQGTSGKVFIFNRAGNVFTKAAEIVATVPAGMKIGKRLKFSADGLSLFMNALPSDNSDGYILEFTEVEGVWTEKNRVATPLGFVTGSNFGKSFDISDDGKILIVGAPGSINTVGCFHLFTSLVAGWNFYRTYYRTDSTVNDGFGSEVQVNADGTLIMVSATKARPGASVQGEIYLMA